MQAKSQITVCPALNLTYKAWRGERLSDKRGERAAGSANRKTLERPPHLKASTIVIYVFLVANVVVSFCMFYL